MSYVDDDEARRAAFADDDDDDDDDWGGGGGGLRSPSDEPSGLRSPTNEPFGDDENEEHFTSSPGAEEEEPQQQQQPQEEYDWSAFKDDSGQVYYYNSKTQESAWEAPDEPYNPLPPEDGGGGGDGGGDDEQQTGEGEESKEEDAMDVDKTTDDNHDYDATNEEQADEAEEAGVSTPQHQSPSYAPPDDDYNDEDKNEEAGTADAEDQQQQQQQATTAEEDASGSVWVAYKDDEGREYFYNNDTGETQWERPESMGPPPSAEEGDQQQQQQEEVTTNDTTNEYTAESEQQQQPPPSTTEQEEGKGAEQPTTPTSAPVDEEEKEEKEPEPEPEPELSPAEKAELNLKQPDAILEPGCFNDVTELVSALGGDVGGPKAIQSLVAGYTGQTAVCGLLGLWLAQLKSFSSSSSPSASEDGNKNNPKFAAAADTARNIAENVVNRIAKEKFTKAGGDNILTLSRSEVAFLEEMFESNRWRKLLIDLSATHKDSALLMYCLQSISKRGHHREIAKRINQSDYFGVFNSMLASELSIIGELAVGGNGAPGAKGDDASAGIDGILVDLKRTCSSTSYTYLYAIEVLKDLVHRVKTRKMSDGPKAAGLLRAVKKWDRLREELEEVMMNPPAAGAASGLNPLARKRRVDVALTISDLHQRQRRRLNPTSDPSANGEASRPRKKSPNETLRDTFDTAVVSLLKKHSLGIQVDKQLADDLLKIAYGGSSNIIGDVLIANPSAIKALLENLFRPGSKRNRSLEVKQKCARLVALAALASERAVRASQGESSSEKRDDLEDKLRKVLEKASQLCEQVENMVQFTVIESMDNEDTSSPGRHLSSLVKYAPVAQGVILWATELASGDDFASTASYPTLSPSIMGLARIISIHHPFTRPAVLNLALTFLTHSNSELSYQTMHDLKQQCLRLLLWLATQGQPLPVFSAITEKLQEGGVIDAALLRYFVGGALDVIGAPVSIPLVKVMGKMFTTKVCMDALNSQYFNQKKKELLSDLIGFFEDAVMEKGKKSSRATADDVALVSTLKSMYGCKKSAS